jgi:hypothetical protein
MFGSLNKDNERLTLFSVPNFQVFHTFPERVVANQFVGHLEPRLRLAQEAQLLGSVSESCDFDALVGILQTMIWTHRARLHVRGFQHAMACRIIR